MLADEIEKVMAVEVGWWPIHHPMQKQASAPVAIAGMNENN
jgi:hypothetical protein